MKILVTGATGFVGKQLCKALAQKGHELIVLARNVEATRAQIPAPHTALEWGVSPQSVPKLDAVIHLAGESLSAHRWDKAMKDRIYRSRIGGTQKLLELLENSGNAQLPVFITASAVGFYGDRGEEILDETQTPGQDYLATVCKAWEETLFHSKFEQTRKVAVRFGIVLGKGGGALEKMVPLFQTGAGAELGTGDQWWSWIHLDDLISALVFCLENNKVSGPVNGCAPEPVTNEEFTRELNEVLHRPTLMKVPSAVLSVVAGEVSTMLLASQRVVPAVLQKQGFDFKYPTLEDALKNILGSTYSCGYDEQLAQIWLPKPIEEVFAFFGSAKNLEVITPPWLNFKTLSQSTPSIQKGTLIDYQLKIHGFPARWKTEISEWIPNQKFVDQQLKGPYRYWHHTHTFQALGKGTLVEDQVLFRLPLGFLGKLVAGSFVRKDVQKIFDYRTKTILELFSSH